jgi:hypothetical protein
MTLPVVITAAGLQPQSPDSLRQQLVDAVAATNPGYTANLPGSLIEDIVGTDVAALAICDSARVELVNSLTPYGANEFLLIQLGNVYGVMQGQGSNTSVFAVFSGPPGFIIDKGFTIGDGTYQYVVQDGGIIASGGSTSPLFCLASNSGIWAVPANTVTQLKTSVPAPFVVTVNNPNAGTPGSGVQAPEDYRAQVLQAGQAVVQGMPTTLKTQLEKVSGVQARLVSVLLRVGVGWEIICGGGDPYEVAYAIYKSLFDVSTIVGSATVGRNISVSINDYPNIYTFPYVNPPQQSVAISLTWNTTAPNFIADAAIAQLGGPALVSYVNAIVTGQPMNLYELQDAFKDAVSPVIPKALLTRMVFVVSIDSVVTPPVSGTGVIAGDPESYFFTELTSITITRG